MYHSVKKYTINKNNYNKLNSITNKTIKINITKFNKIKNQLKDGKEIKMLL